MYEMKDGQLSLMPQCGSNEWEARTSHCLPQSTSFVRENLTHISTVHLDTLGMIHDCKWIAAINNHKSQNIRRMSLILASFFSQAK